MAEIQFIRGQAEEVIPDVRVTRSKGGKSGRAIFYFDNPQVLQENSFEILGMFLVDEEGELMTTDVNAKFINGQPTAIEVSYVMKTAEEWDRFIRFMDRYAESHGLGLDRAQS
ncbi:photosystem II reaction center protein Psb28 [Lyngbya confervoides]|uniref:Photosystem II reaction center Psb28 protein n=1 Tax=Lyngbya confervoides BDU141951 TaxID=1574623 RepID=A0ABD4T9X0_9CYAN|nr:photosystem II reaction center protein Psb28 [Lyngbya confervoides]MCM1985356.1 photosystem II reaction center protein Psb28 [Lyngbya confervoides BDU141951]